MFIEMSLYFFSPNEEIEEDILKKIEKQKFNGCPHNQLILN